MEQTNITLNDYKKNLETGKYKSLAGARRGAGKIQGWDDDTREKAKKLADQFFASGAPVKPAEATPKRGPGRPPGTAAKKPADKPAKAAHAAPAAKPAARAKTAAAAKPAAPKAPRTPAPLEPSRVQQVRELTDAVGTISEALKTIKECQTFVRPEDLREETLTVGRVLSAAVRGLEELVVKPVLPTEQHLHLGDETSPNTSVTTRLVPATAESDVSANGLAYAMGAVESPEHAGV